MLPQQDDQLAQLSDHLNVSSVLMWPVVFAGGALRPVTGPMATIPPSAFY